MSDILKELRRFEGKPAAPPATARDPVSLPVIRRWCDAMGETSPLFLDPAYAATTEIGRPAAPPAMLDVWTIPWFAPGIVRSLEVLDAFDAAGFTSVVATRLRQDYVRYIREGDVISHDMVIEKISDEKTTRLGIGHFVEFLYIFRDQQGEIVGNMRTSLLLYRPRAAPADSSAPGGSASS
jgi:hypothetical protein